MHQNNSASPERKIQIQKAFQNEDGASLLLLVYNRLDCCKSKNSYLWVGHLFMFI